MTNPRIHVRCPELATALDHYAGELGFRLEMIFPADHPRRALLSGFGITLLLESEPAPDIATAAEAANDAVMIQRATRAWGEGRAGMQYRDLIPGRLGGRFVASHIRIPDGGPVADYVHHHDVRFQMIYCYRGWVRVVYEDQGDPFVMRPGDCVLQPPHIRHRVLESSDGMEVIEIGCPAEHETLVDHAMVLPNDELNPDRVFEGQKFVCHQAAGAGWNPWIAEGFEARDIGIAAATGAMASALVMRPAGRPFVRLTSRGEDLYFIFILSGTLSLRTVGDNGNALETGDCFVIPAHSEALLADMTEDLELLHVAVRLPAACESAEYPF